MIDLRQPPGGDRCQQHDVGILFGDERAARVADRHGRLDGAQDRADCRSTYTAAQHADVHHPRNASGDPLLERQPRLAKRRKRVLVEPHVVGRRAHFSRQTEPRLVVERRREAEGDMRMLRRKAFDEREAANGFALVGGKVDAMPALGERHDRGLEVAKVSEMRR
jgi:hypothetical protein